MIKKWHYLLTIVVGIAIAISSFKAEEKNNYQWDYIDSTISEEPLIAHVPNESEALRNDFEVPFTGKSFIAFKQALALRESQGNYDLVNDFGYTGKYQFGGAALSAVGIKDRREFIENPLLQEEAFKALLAINKHELEDEIKKYSGKIINGTEITESGILASAHLLGAGSVKRYLRSNGKTRLTDGYGTSISSYMKKFGGYDTSIIKANANAKAFDRLTKKTVS